MPNKWIYWNIFSRKTNLNQFCKTVYLSLILIFTVNSACRVFTQLITVRCSFCHSAVTTATIDLTATFIPKQCWWSFCCEITLLNHEKLISQRQNPVTKAFLPIGLLNFEYGLHVHIYFDSTTKPGHKSICIKLDFWTLTILTFILSMKLNIYACWISHISVH